MTPKPFWHIHHSDWLLNWSFDIQERIDYIKAEKPKHEVETRLRLLKPVQGALPPQLVQAWAAYDKTGTAYAKAKAAYDKAKAAYVRAYDDYDKAGTAYAKAKSAYVRAGTAYAKVYNNCLPQLEALHAIECLDCPWDGTTIFPTTKGVS